MLYATVFQPCQRHIVEHSLGGGINQANRIVERHIRGVKIVAPIGNLRSIVFNGTDNRSGGIHIFLSVHDKIILLCHFSRNFYGTRFGINLQRRLFQFIEIHVINRIHQGGVTYRVAVRIMVTVRVILHQTDIHCIPAFLGRQAQEIQFQRVVVEAVQHHIASRSQGQTSHATGRNRVILITHRERAESADRVNLHILTQRAVVFRQRIFEIGRSRVIGMLVATRVYANSDLMGLSHTQYRRQCRCHLSARKNGILDME